MTAPLRLTLLLLLLAAGCTRAQYRESADAEAYCILNERIVDPAYDVGRTLLEPSLESRLADPFDPDAPPKPPDDPAAARWMLYPGYMRGADDWERDGCTDMIESVGWEEILARDERGVILLNQDAAVDLALLNSREYQTALENLYLTALALTLNRFEFDLQWFGRDSLSYTHSGTSSLPNERNTLSNTATLGFSRTFATGAQLVTSFANSLVFEFTGANTKQIRSNFVVTLIQPLLRGAGRRVRLENLTQQERNVLYAVRDFARFRKQFWANVATQNGGYLDLLLAMQTVRNNEANLLRQEETYRLYTELFAGGKVSALERDQFLQSYQAAQLTVIQSQTALETQLDRFKIRLGLPPRLPIELDDRLLAEFELENPEILKLREKISLFQTARMAELDDLPTGEQFQSHYDALALFLDAFPEALELAKADFLKWKRRHEAASPEERARPQYELDAQAITNIENVLLPDVEGALAEFPERLARRRESAATAEPSDAFEALSIEIAEVLRQVDALLSIQTQARIQLISLPVIELDVDEAVAVAKAQRLDLQNQKAQVTDAWRRVSVAANALRGGINLVAGANIGTDPSQLKPFNFSAQASQYTLGLELDGPLNRLAERNVYRASLIEYQRAKRAYVALSDEIEFAIRSDLRNLELLELSFEISRQQLLAAARQLESARLMLIAPRDRRSVNDTTTLNLLQALQNLLQARNALAANYINYEQQRVQLLLDLESLQLDSRGFPTDESYRLFGAGFELSNGDDALLHDRLPDDAELEVLPPGRLRSDRETLPTP